MKILKALAVVLVLAATFVAGVITTVFRGWGDRAVTAEVVNNLDQPVRSFTVRYDTCGTKGEITVSELQPGTSRTVRFRVCGEGGALVEATLADGTVMRGPELYVESGYSTTSSINKNGIASTQRMYAL
jgi:hypothetical protein